jgi:hypothetical protein
MEPVATRANRRNGRRRNVQWPAILEARLKWVREGPAGIVPGRQRRATFGRLRAA